MTVVVRSCPRCGSTDFNVDWCSRCGMDQGRAGPRRFSRLAMQLESAWIAAHPGTSRTVFKLADGSGAQHAAPIAPADVQQPAKRERLQVELPDPEQGATPAVAGPTTAGPVSPSAAAQPQVSSRRAETPANRPQSDTSLARATTICVVREIGYEPDQLVEEGLLYPVPLDQPDTVAAEERDGQQIQRAYCNAIEIAAVGSKNTLLRVRDIRALVMLSDARITVACSKFDKGGGWRGWGIGGLVMSVPLNIGSHALAAHRRRGKMLVGQIRYPWIDSVYIQSRVGFSGTEKLRVVANVGGKNLLRLDLTFPKDVDAAAIGTELIRRAARFRLAHDDEALNQSELARLEQLTAVEPLVYAKGSGKMAGHEFPSSRPPSDRSARLGLPALGGPA